MKRPVPLLAAAILGLASDAHAQPAPAAPPDRHTERFTWGFDETSPGDLRLAYGVAETDNTGALLLCRRGSGRVTFEMLDSSDAAMGAHAYGARWKTTLRLASGAMARRYPAHGSSEDTAMMVTAHIRARDPVLRAFARSGRLVVDGVANNVDRASEADGVRRFLSACSQRRP